MESIRRLLISLTWVGCVALVGCATTPDEQAAETEQQASEGESGGEQAADEFSLIPDPYPASRKQVPEEAASQFSQALDAMEAEQWKQARELLEKMTQAYPELSGPYVNLGLVYWKQGDTEAAKRAFEQAISVNPLNGQAYNQLAILHREHGEFEQAEKQYLQALEVWPHNAVIHRNLGILYDLYMGRFEDALHHYQMSQKVAAEQDKRVQGWIVDLERRMATQQAARE